MARLRESHFLALLGQIKTKFANPSYEFCKLPFALSVSLKLLLSLALYLEKIEYLDILKDMPDSGAKICFKNALFESSFESSLTKTHQRYHYSFFKVFKGSKQIGHKGSP